MTPFKLETNVYYLINGLSTGKFGVRWQAKRDTALDLLPILFAHDIF
jgi:hypothetical protein